MRPISSNLIIYTEEIVNGKLHFLCSASWMKQWFCRKYVLKRFSDSATLFKQSFITHNGDFFRSRAQNVVKTLSSSIYIFHFSIDAEDERRGVSFNWKMLLIYLFVELYLEGAIESCSEQSGKRLILDVNRRYLASFLIRICCSSSDHAENQRFSEGFPHWRELLLLTR